MKNTVTLLLAGGMGSRLNILARWRAKPAVPFAGSYRIIDFTLTNAMHAGLERVGVLTQYRPKSLMSHLGNGQPWDLWGKRRKLQILPPFTGHDESDWYRGTADAVYQNMDFVDRYDPSDVLILSGDHIYRMDYEAMYDFHRAKKAALTIAVMPVPWEEASRFGLLGADDDGRVVEFQEKPADPRSNLASMGVYIFSADALREGLEATCRHGSFDFGGHAIPSLFEAGRPIYAYPFSGYWRDVGTIQSYWDANMDLIRGETAIDLAAWDVRTNAEDDGSTELGPAWFAAAASVDQSVVSRGCVIEGRVERSILSPGVRVERGAVVRDSIVMHETVIRAGAAVDRTILDKRVHVGARTVVGTGSATPPNEEFPAHVDTGLSVVGKGAAVPEGARVGRNCLVFPGVKESDWQSVELPSAGTLRAESSA